MLSIYLAHLNPLTNSHIEIIEELRKRYEGVEIMPVRFLKNGKEINSRSFPFKFEIREKMIRSIFHNNVSVSKKYTFIAPYWRYFPPLLSVTSWGLKKKIVEDIKTDYCTYTGDKIEGSILKLYGLNPKTGKRKKISATYAKEKLYESIKGKKTEWEIYFPVEIRKIIKHNWNIIEKYADKKDHTIKIAGMKFPKDGYWSK